MEVTVPNHALQGTLVLANRLAPAGQVVIEDGLIQEIVTDGRRYGPTDGSGDACISPVLINLHIHGIAGADVMDCSQESLDLMARHFAGHGVTGPLPTAVTLSLELTHQPIASIRDYIDAGEGDVRVQVMLYADHAASWHWQRCCWG